MKEKHLEWFKLHTIAICVQYQTIQNSLNIAIQYFIVSMFEI